MIDLRIVPFVQESDEVRVAHVGGARWLRAARVAKTQGAPIELHTADDEETAVLVLGGTYDLAANASSWASRGVRAQPYEGRPVALFLPPRTRLRAHSPAGELLLLSARQPAREPSAKPAMKPLLPLAGSNKAFDATAGGWRPLETFADAPEAIQPRHVQARFVNGIRQEMVFPPAYKALGLCVFEAVLAQGQELNVPERDDAAGYPQEWAAYWRTEGEIAIRPGADARQRGDGVLAGGAAATFTAVRGRCYLAVVYAGPKPAAR